MNDFDYRYPGLKHLAEEPKRIVNPEDKQELGTMYRLLVCIARAKACCLPGTPPPFERTGTEMMKAISVHAENVLESAALWIIDNPEIPCPESHPAAKILFNLKRQVKYDLHRA